MEQLSIINDHVTRSDIPQKPWRFWPEQVVKHPYYDYMIIPTNDADWVHRCKVYAMAMGKGFEDCPRPMPENHVYFYRERTKAQ